MPDFRLGPLSVKPPETFADFKRDEPWRGPKPKVHKRPGAGNYWDALVSAGRQAPAGLGDLAATVPALASMGRRYLKGHTPAEVWSDTKDVARSAAKQWREDPLHLNAIYNLTPFVPDAVDFGTQVRDAAQARADGDLAAAAKIERKVGGTVALNLLPEVVGTGALGVMKTRKALKARKALKEAEAGPQYTRVEGPDGVTTIRRKDLVPETVPAAKDAKTLKELRTLIRNPETNPARRMVLEDNPRLFEGPDPVSSLERQSGIARAYQEAVKGTPEYKHALFERYGEVMPDVVEASGAQNYDQLTEAAYDALGKELTSQFDRMPVSMQFHGGQLEYPTPSAMMRDVLANGNLRVFQGGDPHEFLSKVDPRTKLNQNEILRAVHDFAGHVAPGSTFRAGGEEVAYATHAQTLSPLAQMAMMPETRGQNSLVNYSGLNADITGQMNALRRRAREREIAVAMSRSTDPGEVEAGRRALAQLPPTEDINAQLRELGSRTQFAGSVGGVQRGLLLPPEYLDPLSKGGMPDWLREVIDPVDPTSARGVHISKSPDLTETDPSFYGSGHRGDEYRGVKAGRRPDRTYFYSGPEGTVQPEGVVMAPPRQGPRYGYEAGLQGLYDMEADPEGIVQLSRAYNLPDYEPVLPYYAMRANDALDLEGKSGAADLERMTREYGYKGLIADRPGTDQRWAEMFDPVTGLRRIERGPRGFADGGRVE